MLTNVALATHGIILSNTNNRVRGGNDMAEEKTYSYEEGAIILKTRMVTYFVLGISLLVIAVLGILFLVLYDLFLGGGWVGTIVAIMLFFTLTPPVAILLAKARNNRDYLRALKYLGT